ncbi:hypothetical protein V8E36_007972 [Tilletia maclaganii]
MMTASHPTSPFCTATRVHICCSTSSTSLLTSPSPSERLRSSNSDLPINLRHGKQVIFPDGTSTFSTHNMLATPDPFTHQRGAGRDEASGTSSRGRTMRRTSDLIKSRRKHFTINPLAVTQPLPSTSSGSNLGIGPSNSSSSSNSVSVHHAELPTSAIARYAFAPRPQIDFTEDIGMLSASVAASLASIDLKQDEQSSSSSTAVAAAAAKVLAAMTFEAPTRNVNFEDLLPIMSSLPDDYAPAFDDQRAASIEADTTKVALDYIMLDHGTARLPYTNSRLPRIDDGSFQLWSVLQDFRPITEDYAAGYVGASTPAKGKGHSAQVAPHPLPAGSHPTDAPPPQCPAFASSRSAKSLAAIQTVRRVFNWASLPDLPRDLEQTWYGVAFRSARREGSESANLYEADRRAHEEAVDSGGLLMYWYGTPNVVTGENLATCVWTSRADAIAASRLPIHAEAAAHSLPAFRVYDLTRYAVRKFRGETKLHIDVWTEDDE